MQRKVKRSKICDQKEIEQQLECQIPLSCIPNQDNIQICDAKQDYTHEFHDVLKTFLQGESLNVRQDLNNPYPLENLLCRYFGTSNNGKCEYNGNTAYSKSSIRKRKSKKHYKYSK